MQATRRVSGRKPRHVHGQQKVPVTVRIEKKFHGELKIWCEERGTSPSWVFQQLAKLYWEQFKKDQQR